MKQQNQIAIYYYYDKEGNRRPLSIADINCSIFVNHKSVLDYFKEKNKDLNNLYILIHGLEFKLL